MITPGDIEQGAAREEAGAMHALWASVLRQAVVVDRDLAYLDSEDFLYICGTCGLDPAWTARKLKQAIASKGQTQAAARASDEAASDLKPRAKRTHGESTRAKLRAAAARRRAEREEYERWRAEISAGQAKRWAREREGVAA